MAALLPSMRTRFSNAVIRVGNSAGGTAAGTVADSAGASGRIAASRLASRSASSTTSLRNSPSEVNGRRSMTRNDSSCFFSDKGHSLTMQFDFRLSRVVALGPPPIGGGAGGEFTKGGASPKGGTLKKGGKYPEKDRPPEKANK